MADGDPGPEFLQRYDLLELIGEGAHGRIHRARHRRLRREVAIKFLKANLRDVGTVKRFERESRILASLNHPNILKVFECGQEGRFHYIVTPFITGRNLRNHMNDIGRFPPADAIDALRQITEGLEHCHGRGVLHRDIKPENILVEDASRYLLSDFGIAFSAESTTSLTGAGEIIGTVPYLAPELLTGGDFSPASDLYAVGIIAFELLAGRPPFEGTPSQVLFSRVHTDPPPLGEFTNLDEPDVLAAIDRCLRRAPASRTQAAGQLREVLSGGLARLSSRAPRAGPTRMARESDGALETDARTGSHPRQRHDAFGITAGVALVLALLLALFWTGPSGPREPARIPEASIGRVDTDRPYEVIVHVTRPAAAGWVLRVRDAGGGTRNVAVPAGSRSVAFPAAGGKLSGELWLEGSQGEKLGRPRTFRTPEVFAVRELGVVPMDDRVLVTGFLDPPGAVSVEVSLASSVAGEPLRVNQAPPAGILREAIAGLVPDCDYLLRIHSQDRWGGLAGLPFRTRGSAHRDVISRVLADPAASVSSGAFEALLAALPVDIRLIPALELYLRQIGPDALRSKQLQRQIQDLRAPELASLVVPWVERIGPGRVRSDLVRILALCGALQAGSMARRYIGESQITYELWRYASAIARDPESGDPGRIFLVLDRLPEQRTFVAPYLVQSGEVRVMEGLLQRLADPARTGYAAFSMAALGWSPDPRVSACMLDLCQRSDPRSRSLAVEVLARRGDSPAVQGVRRLLAGPAATPDLVWAAVRMPGDHSQVELRALVRGRRGPDPILGELAVLALGLAGVRDLSTDLGPLLGNPSPVLRRSAAYSIGRAGAREATDRLLDLARSPADNEGVAAWAAARAGGRQAAAGLASVVGKIIRDHQEYTSERVTVLVLALGLTGEETLQALLGQLETAGGADSTRVRWSTAEARRMLQEPGIEVLIHFPFLLYEPAGELAHPGEILEIELSVPPGERGNPLYVRVGPQSAELNRGRNTLIVEAPGIPVITGVSDADTAPAGTPRSSGLALLRIHRRSFARTDVPPGS